MVALAVVFVFQVRAFSDKSIAQWFLLIAIGAVGAIAYFLNKKMKQEDWFIKLHKP